jgi:hypothetical protein
MNKLLAIVCLLNANLAVSQAQAVPEPVEELKGDGIVASAVLVAKENFTETHLTKLAFEYMARYHSSKLIQVGFYTEERTAWDFRGKSVDHFPYEYWKKEYEKRMSSGVIRGATLLAYGNSGTLRIRDGNQQVKEITIVGSNVFHPVLDGLGLNVLHVGFSEQGQPSKLTAHFYMTIPRSITPKEAEMLAKSFFDTTKVRDVTLNIREDEWFIFDAFYPWLNPFTEAKPAPTLKGTARSVQFLCTPEQENTCFQSALGTSQ